MAFIKKKKKTNMLKNVEQGDTEKLSCCTRQWLGIDD